VRELTRLCDATSDASLQSAAQGS